MMIFLNFIFNKYKIFIIFGIITELFNLYKFFIFCIFFLIFVNLVVVLWMMFMVWGFMLLNMFISLLYLLGVICFFCFRQVKLVVMEYWLCDELQNCCNWVFYWKMFLLCCESLEFRKFFIKVFFSLLWSLDFFCLNLYM